MKWWLWIIPFIGGFFGYILADIGLEKISSIKIKIKKSGGR
jgi:hypothetical protein